MYVLNKYKAKLIVLYLKLIPEKEFKINELKEKFVDLLNLIERLDEEDQYYSFYDLIYPLNGTEILSKYNSLI